MNDHRAETIRPQQFIRSKALCADEAKWEVNAEAIVCGECRLGEEDDNSEARASKIAS